MENIIKRLTELADCIYARHSSPQVPTVSLLREAAEKIANLQDDPQWDGTDVAHPAFWRGSEYSCHQAAKLVADVLSGKDIGKGAMNEPCATMRNSVLELKQKFDWTCERLHDLEEENGVYFDQICDLEEENKRLVEKLRLAEERLSSNE